MESNIRRISNFLNKINQNKSTNENISKNITPVEELTPTQKNHYREMLDSFFKILDEEKIERLEDLVKIKPKHKGYVDVTFVCYLVTKFVKPNFMVETGVARGFSTYATLSAMEKNRKGKLFSIDYPTTYQDVGWLPRGKFDENWVLIIGKSKDKLPELLDKLGQIDCFLHDSEHHYKNMMFEFKQAWKHLRKVVVIICDEPTNAFYDFIKEVKPSSSFTIPSRIPEGIIIK